MDMKDSYVIRFISCTELRPSVWIGPSFLETQYLTRVFHVIHSTEIPEQISWVNSPYQNKEKNLHEYMSANSFLGVAGKYAFGSKSLISNIF